MANTTRESIVCANRVFDDFSQKNYKPTTDRLIAEAKKDAKRARIEAKLKP